MGGFSWVYFQSFTGLDDEEYATFKEEIKALYNRYVAPHEDRHFNSKKVSVPLKQDFTQKTLSRIQEARRAGDLTKEEIQTLTRHIGMYASKMKAAHKIQATSKGQDQKWSVPKEMKGQEMRAKETEGETEGEGVEEEDTEPGTEPDTEPEKMITSPIRRPTGVTRQANKKHNTHKRTVVERANKKQKVVGNHNTGTDTSDLMPSSPRWTNSETAVDMNEEFVLQSPTSIQRKYSRLARDSTPIEIPFSKASSFTDTELSSPPQYTPSLRPRTTVEPPAVLSSNATPSTSTEATILSSRQLIHAHPPLLHKAASFASTKASGLLSQQPAHTHAALLHHRAAPSTRTQAARIPSQQHVSDDTTILHQPAPPASTQATNPLRQTPVSLLQTSFPTRITHSRGSSILDVSRRKTALSTNNVLRNKMPAKPLITNTSDPKVQIKDTSDQDIHEATPKKSIPGAAFDPKTSLLAGGLRRSHQGASDSLWRARGRE
ncbi:hypothetical protein LZ554_009534 [Drepanopeziza brunnea f. sp. 'monogermtubi']|nr:hypothetical protein LZ554_009534 [Drepanopeziza brunnea f. sp. 'monogermtubi']